MTGLDVALRTDMARARDALRAVLGDVQLIEENGAVYAECGNAAERLLLAVGGVSMGRVAGEGTRQASCRPLMDSFDFDLDLLPDCAGGFDQGVELNGDIPWV